MKARSDRSGDQNHEQNSPNPGKHFLASQALYETHILPDPRKRAIFEGVVEQASEPANQRAEAKYAFIAEKKEGRKGWATCTMIMMNPHYAKAACTTKE